VLGKHTLSPGESTELTITYNTTGRPGAFRKDIDIETDVTGQSEIQLTMSGTVKEAPGAKIQATPRKLEAGTIKLGETKELFITVKNVGELPLSITKVIGQGSQHVYFDDSKMGMMSVAPAQTQTLSLIVQPVRKGPFTDRIAIQSNAKNAPKGGFIIMMNGSAE
jgi:uncharacterized membrane protein